MKWATSSVSYTWAQTLPLLQDKHPPVYYLFLHFWQALLGWVGLAHNDAALRLSGALLGVLTVAGVLLLAQCVGDRRTARLAALLVALSPLLVWYSQELRMFQPATTAIVWGLFCLVRAWAEPRLVRRLGWWLGFVLCMEAALYSYLFSAFVMPAAGLTLLALLAWSRRGEAAARVHYRSFVEGCIALGVTAALFLPLAYSAWGVNHEEGAPGQPFANVGAILAHLLRVFTVWRVAWPAWFITLAVAMCGLLVIMGLFLPLGRPARVTSVAPSASTALPRTILLLWIGVPLLVGNLLLATSDSVFAEDRYFLFLAPFALWALARGIVMVGTAWRPAGWVSGVAVVVLLMAALPALWTPALARENWRAAADYIMSYQEASPDLPAAIVTHVDYTRLPMEWYVRRRFAFDQLPIFFPFGAALDPEQVEEVIAPPLRGLADVGSATLWLTQSHLEGVDDQRLVEGWLNQNFALVTEQYPAGVKLSGYALRSRFDQLPGLGPAAVSPTALLAPGLTLAACEVVTPQVRATDDALHPPSGWVHVRLWWQASGPIGDDYLATVRMVGPEGVWGERLTRDNDALRRWPTSSWTTSEFMRNEVDVNLNPVTPPGDYSLVVGARDSAGQDAGPTVECGRVVVTP